jgi:transposase
MPIDASPNDLDALRALVSQLTGERDAAIAESRRLIEQNDQLRHLLKQLQRAQFGQRSEQLDRDQMQLALEDIETALANRDTEEPQQNSTADKPADQRKKRRSNRGALPAHLPHVHITIEPESAACPCCHGAMHVIGEESSQRLDKIPAQYQVVVTHRPKYGCRACEGAVVQAAAPERLIRSGIPTERLVASVVVDKFAWHNPLYRQAQIMKLQGLPVDRSTLAFWVGVAAAELKPIYERMKENLLGSSKIAVDETRAPVLDPGRGRTKTGYFWAISRDDRPWGGSDPPAVVYTYAPGRGGVHAAALLAGYSGIVECDGYEVYEQLADPARDGGAVTARSLLAALETLLLRHRQGWPGTDRPRGVGTDRGPLCHREPDPRPQRRGAPCRPASRDETIGGKAQGLARDQAGRGVGEEHHRDGDPLRLEPLGRPGALPGRWPYRNGYE